ncbi:ABC-2 type transporter [Tepidanaerobacter acetatoxydans Re1]|uniref:Transport permease protein n=1 Tax=Tepidanaerobacter acetatoxydans (strain DSM 21804 / JCM 16047 / Re1) TaxID=1209989 RepID=F4LXE5_TEPAE|nr:ABC transporter permease [Tepidanaerobacter acetatoxydans]AEE91047.1 ABC-2 type transporter [Tepidanaerobacter acetatoxydans Re1]CCP25662.1 ABC-2 type transporter [Tepidanaerobacter acetatoxydans Re1]
MKTLAFASRNSKEILRDRLNLAFGIGFPVVLLLLLTIIQSNIPVVLFPIDQLTPGIAVFGLSFISLFSGLLIAKDRTSSFMLRLFTAPLTSSDFIFGYTLPLLPMAILQVAVCFAVAFFLGLGVSINVVLAIIVLTPAALLFIAIGLLCGSLFNEKQVGGVCGALLTNLSAWLSGTWFDLDLVGGAFKVVAGALPFVHAVKAGRAALSGNYSSIFPDLWWVIVYAVVIMVVAILVFTRKMNSDNT